MSQGPLKLLAGAVLLLSVPAYAATTPTTPAKPAVHPAAAAKSIVAAKPAAAKPVVAAKPAAQPAAKPGLFSYAAKPAAKPAARPAARPAANGRMVQARLANGKTVTYNCSLPGNQTKQACKR